MSTPHLFHHTQRSEEVNCVLLAFSNALQLKNPLTCEGRESLMGDHGMDAYAEAELAWTLGHALQETAIDIKLLQDKRKIFIVSVRLPDFLINRGTEEKPLMIEIAHAIAVHKGYWIDSLMPEVIDLDDRKDFPKTTRLFNKPYKIDITGVQEIVPLSGAVPRPVRPPRYRKPEWIDLTEDSEAERKAGEQSSKNEKAERIDLTEGAVPRPLRPARKRKAGKQSSKDESEKKPKAGYR